MTRQRALRIINFFVFLSLGLVFLYLAFRGVEVRDFWCDLKNASLQWVLLALLLMMFSHIVRAFRWNLLIEPLGYRPRLTYTTLAVLIGYFANMAMPRLGEITRCGALNRSDKVPVESLLGTVITERITDLLILLFLLFTVFFARVGFFGSFIRQHIFSPLMGTLNNGLHSPSRFLLIAAIALVSMIVFTWFYRRELKRSGWAVKLSEFLRRLTGGLKSVFKMKGLYRFFLASILMWGLYLVSTYVLFFSIPATSELTMLDALFILVFASLGMTIPVQGGFGTYHLLVTLGLSLYGISREEGLVYAIIAHESQSVFLILAGSISLLVVFLSKRRISTSA